MARSQSTWNPLDRPTSVTYELQAAAEHGGSASVTMRPWTAREAMAFRDSVTRELLTTDLAGDRTIALGVMEARLVCSVVQGWQGDWPASVTRETTEVERRGQRRNPRTSGEVDEVTEPFSLRRLEHLQELDRETYAELVALAREVEPDPLGTGSRALPAANADDDEDDDDDLEDDGEGEERQDPSTSRTSRTTRSPGRRTVQVVEGEVLGSDDDRPTPARSTSGSSPRRSSTPRASASKTARPR